MQSKFGLLVASFSLALFYLSDPALSATPTNSDKPVKYVLTFGSLWRPSQDFSFYLVLFESSNYTLPISFTANLTVSDKSVATQTFQQSNYGLQKHVFQNMKTANVRSSDDSWPSLTVTFNNPGLKKYTDMSNSPQKLTEKFLFIQTDKSLYKPGQDVKIRVLALDRDLKPLANSGDLTVTVTDARGNTIQQWTGQSLQHGFFSKNFTTSDMAVEGSWTVTAEGGQLPSTSKTFEIKQYVLPKYEVSLDFPNKYWVKSTNQANYKGYIRAKYTFGKPVRGKASLAMTSAGSCSGIYYVTSEETVPPILSTTVSLAGDSSSEDGAFTFNTLNDKVFSQTSDWQTECQLSFDVNVTEELTNEVVRSSGTVTIYKYPHKIKVHESAQKTLKPELPFIMRFEVTKPDDSPITDSMTVLVQVYQDLGLGSNNKSPYYGYYQPDICTTLTNNPSSLTSSQYKKQNFTVTTDSNGLAVVTVTPLANVSTTTFFARLVKEPNVTLCDSRSPPKSVSGESVSIFFDRSASQSNTAVKIGDTAKFKIYVSYKASYVYFLMSQNGQPFTYQKLTQPASTDASTGVTIFSVSVTLPNEAVPRASATAWTVESKSNEVLADALEFKVDGFVKQTVTASFSPSSVRPGSSTSLTVKTTDPSAYVALLAVDKSVRLLGSDNDITLDDVIGAVSSGSTGGYIPVGPVFLRCWRCGWWPSWVDSSSAYSVFQGVGMVIYSNAITSQENIIMPWIADFANQGAGGGFIPPPMMAPAGAKVPASTAETSSASNQPETPVRNNFPETWIWQIVQTGSNGQVVQSFTAPDTITTWVVSALAVGGTNGFGALSSPAELTVFQDFFVNLDVSHPTIIRGEQVEVKGVVFNYKSSPITVNLLLKQSSDFDVSTNAGQTFASQNFNQQVQVPGNGGSSIPIWIKPKKLGKINLELSGTSATGGASSSDAMRKEVTVEAEGEVKYVNRPILIRLNSQSSSMRETINVNSLLGADASSVVSGSKMIQLQAIGDILGPALKNLGAQIRLPTGCGEQTMLSLAPNVYIYKYLKSAGILSPDVASQAMDFVNQGYQHELTYQRSDNGISAFGNSDPASSTWLTAFVLRCFHAAIKYMGTAIDQDIITKIWTFLKSQAKSDGTFTEPGHVIHYDMSGGATGDINLAAYIYTTFAEAGGLDQYKWSSQVSTRSKIISTASDPNNKDSYQLALIAYALSILPSDKPTSTQILSRLTSLANNTGGMMSWQPPPKNRTSEMFYGDSSTNEIETAAYALLAMVNNGQTNNSINVARFLMSKRNALGGFVSTQDTVVGLQALSEVAPILYSSNTAIDVTATLHYSDGDIAKSFHIDRTNSQILQSFDPDRSRQALNSVDISATGSGIALVQLAIRYNIQNPKLLDSGDYTIVITRDNVVKSAIRKPIAATATSKPLNDTSVQLKACVKPVTQRAKRGMVVLEQGVPTGFVIDLDGTQSANRKGTKRIYSDPLRRIEAGDRKIVYYFDSLTNSTCVVGKLKRTSAAKNVQPPMARVYAYYSPTKMTNAANYTFRGMSAGSS